VETEVSLEDDGGTFVVPVTINDTISLKFTLDSGASDVSIPADVASTLIRSGTITRDDFIGAKTFVLADGTPVPSAEFRIRSLKIGTLVLHDVTASLADARGPLLLGQSFLTRLSSWSIDNGQHLLRLKAADAQLAAAAPQADIPVSEATSVARADRTTDGPGADPGDDAQQTAQRIATTYFAAWSDPRDPSGGTIRRFYGPTVRFYGRAISVDDLMAQKAAFAHRWPTRAYAPRASSVVIRCVDAHACTVTGVVDWIASDTATGRRSAGVADFSMGLQDGLIVAEAGHVLSRN
jgi:clan AA aspartic protease (TIGR02281 family)